ncbi:uncharacterized protein LOC116342724 [Contarinia nasturtii]|uniref:uncharacterized protein LOC116342724 n=1 Tax=Contarinia nasturtii TaxID=265458 RepID=UPI0012D39B00|nr:uncharacterized protein LOC116342724 [Contarinia nasturtii]
MRSTDVCRPSGSNGIVSSRMRGVNDTTIDPVNEHDDEEGVSVVGVQPVGATPTETRHDLVFDEDDEDDEETTPTIGGRMANRRPTSLAVPRRLHNTAAEFDDDAWWYGSGASTPDEDPVETIVAILTDRHRRNRGARQRSHHGYRGSRSGRGRRGV